MRPVLVRHMVDPTSYRGSICRVQLSHDTLGVFTHALQAVLGICQLSSLLSSTHQVLVCLYMVKFGYATSLQKEFLPLIAYTMDFTVL